MNRLARTFLEVFIPFLFKEKELPRKTAFCSQLDHWHTGFD